MGGRSRGDGRGSGDTVAGQAPARPSTIIRVAILADIRLYREGLGNALRREPDMEVLATAASGAEAAARIGAVRPDVVLVDMAMLASAAMVRALIAGQAGVRVVALAVPETERHVMACAEAGVVGYVPREGSMTDLLAAIRGAVVGEARCSPVIAGSLLRRVGALAADHDWDARGARLTRRETEIVGMIDGGLTNKEIARRLHIEVATVKNHVHNILEKLGVHRRADAAARLRHQPLGG